MLAGAADDPGDVGQDLVVDPDPAGHDPLAQLERIQAPSPRPYPVSHFSNFHFPAFYPVDFN